MNDVSEGCASKLLWTELAKSKPHRVHDIGFAGAVWPRYDSKTSVKLNCNLLAKGFETSQLDFLDVDQNSPCP